MVSESSFDKCENHVAHTELDTYGIRTCVIPCDVSDHSAVCGMFDQIRAFCDGGGIDILINADKADE